MGSGAELDHVLIAAGDLAEAARDFESRYGVGPIEGGRHPGWGTANMIVPLGEAYLELVAIVDEAEAADSAFGRWVAAAGEDLRPFGWAVRTTEIDDVADRLDLSVDSGSRLTSAGQRLQWRVAGIERAAAEPSLPFFIEWGEGTPFPGRAAPATAQIECVELTGDRDRLDTWLGEHDLPIVMRAGPPAVAGFRLKPRLPS